MNKYYKKSIYSNSIWIILFIFLASVIYITILFEGAAYPLSNTFTLIAEIFLALMIAIIAYRQNKKNQKVSQFIETQINFVQKEIGSCLFSIFTTLYSTSWDIKNINNTKYDKNAFNSYLKRIKFHYEHSVTYIGLKNVHFLGILIRNIENVVINDHDRVNILYTIMLTLDRTFPNEYAQKGNYILCDFLLKYQKIYPITSVKTLSILKYKQTYDEFITDKVYDIKAIHDWVNSHLDNPTMSEINSFVPRINQRIEEMEGIKKFRTVDKLDESEIDAIIKIYNGANTILAITQKHNIDTFQNNKFFENTKIFFNKYKKYIHKNDRL